MKLTQSIINKSFTIEHKGKEYYVNYLNSDGQILGLINRDYWEIIDEDGEELDIYEFRGKTRKQKEQIKKNIELRNKIINFCIKHFNKYQPKL